MLDTIVRHLHQSLVPFKLSSYPSFERMPQAAQPIPRFAVLLDTQLVLVAGKLSILAFPTNASFDRTALANALGAPVLDPTDDDLPEALRRFTAPPPAFGQLFGLPVIMDTRVADYETIVFQLFGESDYVEIPYDEFARQEQPRLVSFTRAGELPPREPGRASSCG